MQFSGYVKDDELSDYYNKTNTIVSRETKADLLYILQSIEPPNNNLKCDMSIECDDITTSEKNLLRVLDLEEGFVEKTFLNILKRNSSKQEIEFHIDNNKRKNINEFAWICILNTCAESAPNRYFSMKPRIALLLSGYLRNNRQASQERLINSPHVDVFIHTWDDLGFKNDRKFIERSWLSQKKSPVSEASIINKYNPKKILVEENKLDSFSLTGKISPIFLYYGQAKDDATRYINSQLYSIYSSYKLMKEYEDENGFKYDGIIRLRFDFNISNIDIPGIIEDLKQDSIYFPHASCNGHAHAGGGGGCLSCDAKKQHDKHTNDICDIWFYGKRDIAATACELYLRGLDIMKQNHDANMKQLRSQIQYSEKNGFVYINTTKDIENNYVCFYPERLLREGLVNIPCVSSKKISGRI